MRKFFYAGMVVLSAFHLSGCSWFSHRPAQNGKSIPVYSGRILNAPKDLQAAKVLIVPFRAGEGVESTEELDKVTLMIVKGIAEAFETGGLSIEILSDKNQDEAQFIVQGHVTSYQTPSRMKRVLSLKKVISLAVKGKMLKVGSNQPVLVFEEKQQAKDKKTDGKYLGYVAGQNIGRFILSATASATP